MASAAPLPRSWRRPAQTCSGTGALMRTSPPWTRCASYARQVECENERLDVLVNNAGIGMAGPREESEDGYELRFAVNYLAGYLLTRMLLPLLERSAPARIVNVSSAARRRSTSTT